MNLLLEVLVIAALGTGVASWAVGSGWGRLLTAAHGVIGLAIVVLAPAKIQRSVRPGLRRRRATKWFSVAFGVLVVSAVILGLVHASGLWWGVGYWTPLWTHFLVAFAAVPLFAWHLLTRPVSKRPVDRGRRLVVGSGIAFGVATAAYLGQEGAVRLAGLPGGTRRFTGSHEIGSDDPDAMPVVSWIDDRTPVDREGWLVTIAGRETDPAALWPLARPVRAVLDCTGGWWSEHDWDAVPLSELLPGLASRSIRVTSSTGYQRLVPASDASSVYLAVGYGGRPLRGGHGAPVRLVAPGRRGPWWVKWVTAVEPDNRPSWFQPLFPTT